MKQEEDGKRAREWNNAKRQARIVHLGTADEVTHCRKR